MPVSVDKNTGLMSLSEAVVVGISGSAVPGVSRDRILEVYGPIDGPVVFDEVVALVREAVAMPIRVGPDVAGRRSERHCDFSGRWKRPASFTPRLRCVGPVQP